MLFHLIRKEVLIVKKYVLIMFIAAILIPPFMLWRAPEFTGILGFMLSVIFAVFMLLQYVSLKEYQFPRAATLLCSTPYSRKMMVLAKYIFCISIYVVCCVIFRIETLVIHDLGGFDLKIAALMLLLTSIFIGIYLPVQYKLGYEKTKFVFIVVIMVSPILLAQLIKMGSLNLDFLSAFSPLIVYGGIILISILILSISVMLSIRIYEKIDLV